MTLLCYTMLYLLFTGVRPLTTVLVVKPDVVQKKLGKLLKRVTQEGFRVVALRLELLTKEQAACLVPLQDKEVIRDMAL